MGDDANTERVLQAKVDHQAEHDLSDLTLVQVLAQLASAVNRLRFWSILTALQTALGAIALGVMVFVAFAVYGLARTNLDSNDALRQNQQNLPALVAELLAEIDCMDRRLHARLPAPPPRECRANTPSHIYPGS